MEVKSPTNTVVIITAIENVTSSLGTHERVVSVCETWELAWQEKAKLDNRKHFGVVYRLQEKSFITN